MPYERMQWSACVRAAGCYVTFHMKPAFSLAFLLLASPALAQTETVTVTAGAPTNVHLELVR